MSVEKLVQNLKTEESALIIDSISTLTKMITENARTQEEIIKYLPGKDILRIMRCLEDSDIYLRKLTAKFFLDLVYGNYVVQQVFCDILGIIPCDGKICINKFPDAFKNMTRILPECLELLRKIHPEELKADEVPYCWYFGVQQAEQPEKRVEFLNKEDRDHFDIDQFPDPSTAMIGFVMRNPRKFQERGGDAYEKYTQKAENKKKDNSNLVSRYASSANSSLDHSINSRLLNESKSPQRALNKYHSPMRGSIGKSPVFSSRYNYGRGPKNQPVSAVSQSLCKTERLVTNEFESSVERDDLTYKSIDRDINIEVVMNKYEEKPKSAHIKKKSQKDGDFSIEAYENFQNSKLIASINESQELNHKLLETSLNNSISTKPIRSHDRSPNVTYAEISLAGGKAGLKKGDIKKTDGIKKPVSATTKPKTAGGERITTLTGTEKVSNTKDLKIKDTQQFYPVSALSTPKNNLLSKILKDKPIVKDSLYSNKHKAKQETQK